ncbi:glycosyltransferase family 25 protein [Pasteurella multocida]|uniref:glycosyltransferase family 25 protein n=1 Tax=Pasteurella multocida TaxID=747 RepID=UPI002B47EC0D|nr:glycosyltransferase family 25 protein [Pasteurella multocida]MEB3476853.1 glycosyltransferase family 25 protein [Pasteurella multocida]MEB3507906.1 glycosyltransferase family 25 protein [Pasteurella multocida]WRJ98978.1 glycosyltransferase family 25 protein [Pasteurella multocida]
MTNYVISLLSAKERRQHVINEFSKHQVPFQFFDAISPSSQLDSLIQELIPNLNGASLTGGEKGCLISHLALWHKCIQDNSPYVTIFEDDILLGRDARKFLGEDEWLFSLFNCDDIFIIRLETFLQPTLCQTPPNPISYCGRDFLVLKDEHLGTAGYIISLGAAKYLLEIFKNMESNNIFPIDHLIFNRFLAGEELMVYQLSPALCIQELQLNENESLLDSQLESERKNYRLAEKARKKKTWREKVYHIFTKPHRMLKKRKERAEKNAKMKLKCIVKFE